MDGKVDSDVKLYIHEVFREFSGEIKKELRNGHPTTKVGKAIQNNLSVIVSTFVMVLTATLVVVRENTELRIAVMTTLPKAIETSEAKLRAEQFSETAMRKIEDENNKRERGYLLKKLEDADTEIARRVNAIDVVVQNCCPRGGKQGMIPGESPIYRAMIDGCAGEELR